MKTKFDAEDLNLILLAKEYSNERKARKLFESLRWPGGKPICPHCKNDGEAKPIYKLTSKPGSKHKIRAGTYCCGACRKKFTATVGTSFEDSHVPISKWLMAIFILCSSKKSVSALQLSRMLKTTYKTAWFMAMRVRHAMATDLATANPSGVSFSVDGTTYSTPQTFSWVSGSSHPIGTTSPQSGGTGVQYIWNNWSDAGAVSHNVAPTSGTTFTANFSTQYRLDMSASPAGGGTVAVNPPGTWFPPSQGLQLTASPASGYTFLSWAGVDSSSGNSASVTMNGYRSVTANFSVVSSAYTFITLAGSANAGSQNGAGATAGFNFETGTASDKAGNVYVADTYNSTIRKISPAGMVTTVAGLAGNPGSANGIGGAARFLWPNGVAVEENGTVYVADTYNNTIRKITLAGSVSTLAGVAGIAGFADGTSGVARFNQPGAVAVDSNGVLYVADGGNNSIRKITPGGLVSTLAGWTNAGYADGFGTNSLLNGPAGITVDANGNVFVADTGNDTIRKIATNGMVSTLAGLAGSAGHADGVGTNAQFNGPTGIAVDAAGNVYVADTYNYTIRRIGTDGTVTTIAGMSGQYGYQDGTGTNALFDFASGIAVDGRGAVYVADTDNNVIRKGWWAGTPTAIVLQSPKMNDAQVNLDFTVLTGPSSGFTLMSADQAGGPWGSDATAVLTTNVLGVSYGFTTWPGVSMKFYRIRSP